jgi:pectinesterase
MTTPPLILSLSRSILAGLLCCAVIPLASAQPAYYPRDTSYSIRSAFEKIKERHPGVSPVPEAIPTGVRVDRNRSYARLSANRALYADVFYPKPRRHRLRPAVLLIYGGGWRAGAKENQHPLAAQLARAGYVAFAVEYRLSGEALFPAAVHDLKAAVRWIRAEAERYGVDTTRIAALGCSAGAQLASFLGTTNGMARFEGEIGDATEHSSSVQAVLNIDGIVSFIHPEAAAEEGGPSARGWLGGTKEAAFANWQAASPLEYAGPDTPPFLFVNSAYPRFHAGRNDLFLVLDRYGIHHEDYTFSGAPHSFWHARPWFDWTVERAVGFLGRVFA